MQLCRKLHINGIKNDGLTSNAISTKTHIKSLLFLMIMTIGSLQTVHAYALKFMNLTSKTLRVEIRWIGMAGEANIYGIETEVLASDNLECLAGWAKPVCESFNIKPYEEGAVWTSHKGYCFKSIWTYWQGKKIDMMKYHHNSLHVNGCADIWAILEEKPGGNYHKMVWSGQDIHHKHYKRHRDELAKKKWALKLLKETDPQTKKDMMKNMDRKIHHIFQGIRNKKD